MAKEVDSDKFRLAIIGAGHIAQVMTNALKKSRNIDVVAVASRELENATNFAINNNIPNYYGSYDELIFAEGYDLIYIATVNSTHFSIAKRCIENHKPVIIEKPICLNVEEAKTLISMAKENNTFLAEAMPLRYSSNMKEIKKLIDDGIIGNVSMAFSNIGINCWGTERIRRKDLGGGALYDLGVYGITTAMMLFDSRITGMKSEAVTDNDVDAQNTFIATGNDFQYVCFNSVKLQTNGKTIIYGDKSRIIINKAYNADRVIAYAGIKNLRLFKSKKSNYLSEIEACARAIKQGKIETEEYKHDDILKAYEMFDEICVGWK